MFPELTRDDVFRLETRRLWLRWPRMADASAILRQAGEKAVAEMTASIPHPYPVEAVEPFIFAMRKGNALGEHLVLAITPRSKPNELIGMIGAHRQATGVPFHRLLAGNGPLGQGSGDRGHPGADRHRVLAERDQGDRGRCAGHQPRLQARAGEVGLPRRGLVPEVPAGPRRALSPASSTGSTARPGRP